tara:strand:- start:534 stop:1022 length:489 start_codon:yes stop_codon:yes gene_type:complete
MSGYEKPSSSDLEYQIQQQRAREAQAYIDKIMPPSPEELKKRQVLAEENRRRRAQGLPMTPISEIHNVRIGEPKPGKPRVFTEGNQFGIPVRGWNKTGPPPPPPKQEFPPRPPGLSPRHWEEMHRQRKKEWEMRRKLWPDDPGLSNRERYGILQENMQKDSE